MWLMWQKFFANVTASAFDDVTTVADQIFFDDVTANRRRQQRGGGRIPPPQVRTLEQERRWTDKGFFHFPARALFVSAKPWIFPRAAKTAMGPTTGHTCFKLKCFGEIQRPFLRTCMLALQFLGSACCSWGGRERESRPFLLPSPRPTDPSRLARLQHCIPRWVAAGRSL